MGIPGVGGAVEVSHGVVEMSVTVLTQAGRQTNISLSTSQLLSSE